MSAGRSDGLAGGATAGGGPVSATRPLVLLCECAGTMRNIDFDALEERLAAQADVRRDAHWCARRG